MDVNGLTTEKERRCMITKRARGKNSPPLVAERSTRRAVTSKTLGGKDHTSKKNLARN